MAPLTSLANTVEPLLPISVVNHTAPIRVAWVHVPKTGTSFATTLMHYANSSLPTSVVVARGGTCTVQCDPTVGRTPCRPCIRSHGAKHATLFPEAFPFDTWFRGVFPVGDERDTAGSQHFWFGDHFPIGGENDSPYYERHRGHLFAMFREPSRRHVSDYVRARHLGAVYRGRGVGQMGFLLRNPPPGQQSLLEHARMTQGLTVRMLATNQRCFSINNSIRNTCAEVPDGALELARRRLSEGFAYVGDTDEWETSICLFHAMFGGRCLGVEMINSRPTSDAAADLDAQEALAEELKGNFTDPIDAVLYADARLRFEHDLRTYGVTPERCAAMGCSFSHERRFFAE